MIARRKQDPERNCVVDGRGRGIAEFPKMLGYQNRPRWAGARLIAVPEGRGRAKGVHRGVGDAASIMQNGHPVPGVAQAAIQEGRYVGRLIASELKGRKVKRPFRYFDKGNMAVVGKNYAVLERGWLRTSGFPDVAGCGRSFTSSPAATADRLRVQHHWLWSYFTGQRSSRLIPETLEPGR